MSKVEIQVCHRSTFRGQPAVFMLIVNRNKAEPLHVDRIELVRLKGKHWDGPDSVGERYERDLVFINDTRLNRTIKNHWRGFLGRREQAFLGRGPKAGVLLYLDGQDVPLWSETRSVIRA